jgi:threonine aldolase
LTLASRKIAVIANLLIVGPDTLLCDRIIACPSAPSSPFNKSPESTRVTAPLRQNFTSDNVTGCAPEILAALGAANAGTAPGYGSDAFSERLAARAREVFECELAILPVATGTAANALALGLLTPPYGAIYCHETAHVMTDECGAPEFYSGGAKLLCLSGAGGKIAPASIAASMAFIRTMGVHHVQPAAVTLSQATEWGTVYSLAELEALGKVAREHRLGVHMDGARFANALAHLGCSPAEATWKRGVDILSLGATKNGALAAEAIVLFKPERAAELGFLRKRAGHLWSKMRFLSAQLLAYLEGDLWLRHARTANALAARLGAGLAALGGRLLAPVDANEVFISLPATAIAGLRAGGYEFYDWITPPGEQGPAIRLVTAYDMATADVDALLQAAARHLSAPRR